MAAAKKILPCICDPNGRLKRVPLATLKRFQGNLKELRSEQYEKLKASMELKGFIAPIFVWAGHDYCVDGHQRLNVLEREGWDVEGGIPVVEIEAADEKDAAEKLLLLSSTYGKIEPQGLYEFTSEHEVDLRDFELPDLPDFDLGAFVVEFYDGANGEQVEDPGAQMDRAEELQKKWETELGQLWVLGDHKLICGDCTDRAVVERVMGGEKADLCFTSPPYAEQRKEQYGGIPEEEYWDWFEGVQACVRLAISANANFVLNIKGHARDKCRSLYVWDLVCAMVRLRGWLLVDEFVWLRTGIPQQVVDRFKNAFEPCYWFAASSEYEWYPEAVMHHSDSVPLALGKGAGDTDAARRQGKGGGAIQGNSIVGGMAYPSNVLDFKQNAEALGHPAAFPVSLPSFFVKCMSAPGKIVFDPFFGSGTTLMACEQLGRQCRAIEISPAYVAVTLERWFQATGKTPALLPGVLAPANVAPEPKEHSHAANH